MHEMILRKLAGKRILLLGFGREGRSSYTLIRKIAPDTHLTIADRNDSIRSLPEVSADPELEFNTGEGYLSSLDTYDLILKSPGISLKDLDYCVPPESITSQTDLFLQAYSQQVIGVTGTKGKSTVSTLIHHILKKAERETVLLGNIGRPAFDLIGEITPRTIIVFEMSSHQLEYISVAPHIAILLNLYEEHLDAYPSFVDYQRAKMNIAKYQKQDDYFIYTKDDIRIAERIAEMKIHSACFPFSLTRSLPDGCYVSNNKAVFSRGGMSTEILDLDKKRKLKGDHNLLNILSAATACMILNVDPSDIAEGVAGFTGLEHRIEFAGTLNGITFYNDSIATIPEACMEAVKALGDVDTLILGGFDRGINYTELARFLCNSTIRNFIFTGEAGQRIRNEMEAIKVTNQQLFTIHHFDEFLGIALRVTRPGKICLLSPAAASYNEFQNFEMRGMRYKSLINGYQPE
jgi:UDP-N-acetylmuramoyl-L-alanine---L-glutamate ligase